MLEIVEKQIDIQVNRFMDILKNGTNTKTLIQDTCFACQQPFPG